MSERDSGTVARSFSVVTTPSSGSLALFSGRALALLSACALALSSLAGCTKDEKKGGLVVVLETDLAMPKDIDRISLEIYQQDKMLLGEERDLGADRLVLPAEFRIGSTGNSQAVTVRAVAYKNGTPRIERSAITPVPQSRTGLLRLSLNYLCDGMANDDGTSSCGDELTCKQAVCGSSIVSAEDLPSYEPDSDPAAAGGSGSGPGGCFNALACFATASEVTIDPLSCSFEAPPQAQSGQLNVALKLAANSDGVCGEGACWIVLDSGTEGWSFDGVRLSLPAGICAVAPDQQPFRVALSDHCATKSAITSTCGSSSSWMGNPVTGEPTEPNGTPPPVIGDACDGPEVEACGDCGTRRRSCRNGTWSIWSECTVAGSCSPDATQACGDMGTQSCGGSCEWGDCLGQACVGPNTQACGNCGTQFRTCNNGKWSDWNACVGQASCKPDTTQNCGEGASGTQACGGNCEWGDCGNQVCPGASSSSCGMCGSRVRICDIDTALWSDWSICTGEGMCMPNATRTCGTGGTQTCGGNCQWDAACRGQTCTGAASQRCGNCGAQTRTCDNTTGTWSAWTACSDEGSCAPNATRTCGASGVQTCGGNCEWDAACTGQMCQGAATRTCGNCGMQTRTCDTSMGVWSSWSACTGAGVCAPGMTQTCPDGTQTCSSSCQWGTCTALTCPTTEAPQRCGRCNSGTLARTCNGNTGMWMQGTACSGETGCTPDESQTCPNGRQTCNDSCQLGACTPVACPTSELPERCGNCDLGTQERTCDGSTGQWVQGTACSGNTGCTRGARQPCPSGGSQTCSDSCEWGTCPLACPTTEAPQRCGRCNSGTLPRTCNGNTGMWIQGTACSGETGCTPGESQTCPNGRQTCNNSCQLGACTPVACPTSELPERCGNCDLGTQERTCDGSTGQWVQGTACSGNTGCTRGARQTCPSGGSQTCSDSCEWGACAGIPCPTTEPPVRCGNCSLGTQARMCDASTGTWVQGTECVGDTGCRPADARTCGGTGRQVCDGKCQWATCDCGGNVLCGDICCGQGLVCSAAGACVTPPRGGTGGSGGTGDFSGAQ